MIEIPTENDRNPSSNTPLGKNVSQKTRLFARFVSSKPEEIGGKSNRRAHAYSGK